VLRRFRFDPRIFLFASGDISRDPPAGDQVLDVAKPFGSQRHQATRGDKALLAIGQGDARPLSTAGAHFAVRAFEAEQTDEMQPERPDLGRARLRGGADRRFVRARIGPVDIARHGGIEEFREGRTPVYIRATIYVERDSQKRILIGEKGGRIREIGRAARVKIERLVGSAVYLDLWVKVLANWRRDARALERFGYRMPQEPAR